MARKLKVQLEVNSSKARSTVARDMSGIDIGGTSRAKGPDSSGAAADRLANSLDNAAKKSGALASSHEVLSAKTRQVAGAFTGMGVSTKARSTVARDMSGIDIGGTSRAKGPDSSGAAADRLANSLDNAAKKSGALASSHEVLSAKTRQVAGAFKARSTVARDMSGINIGGTSRAMGPHSSGAAADRLAKSLDNAAKKSGDLASSHEVLSAKTRQIVGAFTGMGVSMAMSFASQNMKRGSARSAVEVGAGTLQGAAMGGMAGGPWGALAGGVIGLGMGLWNKSQERKRYTEDWGKSEHDYASDKAFQNLVKSLTDVSDKTVDFGAKIKAVEEELEKYKQVEGKLKANVESFIKSGRYDDADAQRGYLAENRQRQEQLEAAKKQLEGAAKKEDEKTIEAIGPGGGTDALQKVGGMRGVFPAEKMDNLESGFRSAVQSANRNLEKLEEDGNKVLREIAANTRKQGVSKWQ